MPLTNAGLDAFAASIIGQLPILFDNANARLAVGDGTTAESPSQTNLQGTTTFRRSMDPGYPTVTGSTLIFRATFGEEDANFAWNEWGVFNAAVGGTMLDRRVEYNGTKLEGQTWVFQVELELTIEP
jgi:hypothetical protein